MTPTDPRAEILGIIRRIDAARLEGLPSDIVARETGHEVIVVAHHDSKWRAVWRAMLPAST